MQCILSFVCSNAKTVKIEKKHFKMIGKICGKICMLGLSSFITQFALVIVIAVVNNTIKTTGAASVYGADIPVSSMGIVQKVSQILTSIVLGLATGILPIISYNYGSCQYDRVKKLYKNEAIVGTAVMVIAWLILEIFPAQIVSIFGKQDELYLDFARICMQRYMTAIFTVGISTVTTIFFQAIDKPFQSTGLSLLRQIIILFPAVLILGSVGSVTTVLWAGPISDSISCVVSIIVLAFIWKKIFSKEALK